MQLIGDIQAAGKTPEQLGAAIRDKLLETMRNPEVSVQVTKINSRKFTIQRGSETSGNVYLSAPRSPFWRRWSTGRGFAILPT